MPSYNEFNRNQSQGFSHYVEAYAGELKNNADIKGNENELFWTDLNNNFFDMKLYAGEGNIGHMIEQIKIFKDKIFI